MPGTTRNELGDFIEELLSGKVEQGEWDRLIVAHYRDEVMEAARIECVRTISVRAGGDVRQLAPKDIDRLRATALALRA